MTRSDQLAKYLSLQGCESIFIGKQEVKNRESPERADCLLFGRRGLHRSAGIRGPDPAAEALSVADRPCLCAMFEVPIKRPQHADAICRIGPSS